MNFKKTAGIGCLGVLAGVLVFWLALVGAFQVQPRSPFERDDICFKEEQPGATGRYILYVPVRCSDESQQLAPGFGADYATLDFEDVDRDGTPEAIVASSRFRCSFGTGSCYDAWRIVVKVCPACKPVFTVLERQYLEELTPEDQARR